MTQIEMKKWTAGAADDSWKIMVCARDASRADDLLRGLAYILTDAGNDHSRAIAILRNMSGAEIIDALVAYQQSAHQSVQNGLRAAHRRGARD